MYWTFLVHYTTKKIDKEVCIMEKRKLLVEEQLNEDEVYNLYYKYMLEEPDVDWSTGACYIRVSTNEQDKYSPASQLKEILDYALKHHTYIPKEYIFQDIGKSGMKEIEKRIDFLKMMELAKNGSFKTLLLYRFSRLARKKEDSVYYKAKLRKEYNIDVISIREELPQDNSRVLIESMYEGQDEYYVLNFRDETKRGKKEKLARGEWLNRAPYGYKFDKNSQTLVVVDEMAKNVKLIYDTFVSNCTSIKSVVKRINSLNIPSPRGGLWSDISIKRVLQNPAYIGYMRHCEGGFGRNYRNENIQLYKGNHPAIIDQEIFDKAQEKMNYFYSKHKKYAKPAAMHAHWLSGIMKCSNCGHTLVRVATSSRKPWFQCCGYTKSYCEISHHITEEVAVKLILEQLKNDFSEKLDINIIKPVQNFNDDITLLNSEISKLETRLSRIKIAYQDGIDTLEEYKMNKININKKIDDLKKQLLQVQNKNNLLNQNEIIYKKCSEAYRILSDDNASLDLKIEITNNLFDKIVYNKANNELLIYYKL